MKQYVKKLSSRWIVKSTRSHDDLFSIRYATYQQGRDEPTRYIVYMNGRTEWIEKNMELPELLNLPENCGFLSMDHRGQGASGGARSYIRTYDDYILDAKRVIEEALEGKPYVILGHSMGGLISIYGVLRGVFTPYSMALNSPLLKLVEHPLPNIVALPVAQTLTLLGFAKQRSGAGSYDKSAFARNKLTHDPDAYMVSCNSPYRVPSATFGWVTSTFKALSYVHSASALKKLSAPTLILSPSEEVVVDPKGQILWVKNASKYAKVDVQLVTIHGARHETFSELPVYRDRGLSSVRSWFKAFIEG